MEELTKEISKVSPIFLVPLDLLTEEKIEEIAEIAKVSDVTLSTWKAIVRRIREYGNNLYNEGYDEGDAHGYNRGHDEGKKEGYDKGKEDGYEDGKFNASLRIEQDPFLSLDMKRQIKQRIWG